MNSLNWIKVLLILNLCSIVLSAKSRDLYFYDIRIDFNPKFGNATWDMTTRANSTRTHPSRFTGSVKLCLLIDVTNLKAKIRVTNLKSGSVLFDKVLNLCNLQKQRSAFYLLTAIFDEVMSHLGIAYQCPIKKGVYEVKSFEFKQAIIPDFIKTNESFHWIVEIKSKIGKTMETASKVSSIVDIVEIDY